MRLLFLILITTAVALAISACSAGEKDIDQDAESLAIKIAFIGDQGSGSGTKTVLELIRDEKADMVLHQGDFDYQDDPDSWMNQIDDILGSTFPYFASVGNHDVTAWAGYQAKLQSRQTVVILT